jgi:hypothetical protein
MASIPSLHPGHPIQSDSIHSIPSLHNGHPLQASSVFSKAEDKLLYACWRNIRRLTTLPRRGCNSNNNQTLAFWHCPKMLPLEQATKKAQDSEAEAVEVNLDEVPEEQEDGRRRCKAGEQSFQGRRRKRGDG